MTSKEFVIWLKGFTEGVHEFNITPKQWDILKDKLAEVSDLSNTRSIPSIWTSTPSTGGTIFTTTSGSKLTGVGTYTYPNGTTVAYTVGGANEFDEPKDKTLLND